MYRATFPLSPKRNGHAIVRVAVNEGR